MTHDYVPPKSDVSEVAPEIASGGVPIRVPVEIRLEAGQLWIAAVDRRIKSIENGMVVFERFYAGFPVLETVTVAEFREWVTQSRAILCGRWNNPIEVQ